MNNYQEKELPQSFIAAYEGSQMKNFNLKFSRMTNKNMFEWFTSTMVDYV